MRIKAPKFYYQEMELMEHISDYIQVFSAPFLIICEKKIWDRIGSQIQIDLEKAKISSEIVICEDRCKEEVVWAYAQKYKEFKTVVGIGERGALDLAKAVGYNIHSATVVIPTAAYSNVVCSSEVVIQKESGNEYLKLGNCPDMVLVDPEIIVSSSPYLLGCGMAAVLAAYLENRVLLTSEISGRVQKGTVPSTVSAVSREAYETILQYGPCAWKDMEQHRCSDAIDKVIEAIFYLGGIGLENGPMAAIRPIVKGICTFQEIDLFYEEAVSIGILVQMIMNGEEEKTIQKIKQLLKGWKLPVCLSEIGIREIPTSAKQLAKHIQSFLKFDSVLPFSMGYEWIAGAFLLLEED